MIRIQVAIQGRLAEMAFAVIKEDVTATRDRIDNQIEVSIAIDIGKACSSDIESRATHACNRSDVLEMPIAQVTEEMAIACETRQENVAPPIAVHIGRGHSGAVEENLVGEVPFLREKVREQDADRAIVHERKSRLAGRIEGDFGITEPRTCFPIEAKAGLNQGDPEQKG
jgi:hypothetical protein